MDPRLGCAWQLPTRGREAARVKWPAGGRSRRIAPPAISRPGVHRHLSGLPARGVDGHLRGVGLGADKSHLAFTAGRGVGADERHLHRVAAARLGGGLAVALLGGHLVALHHLLGQADLDGHAAAGGGASHLDALARHHLFHHLALLGRQCGHLFLHLGHRLFHLAGAALHLGAVISHRPGFMVCACAARRAGTRPGSSAVVRRHCFMCCAPKEWHFGKGPPPGGQCICGAIGVFVVFQSRRSWDELTTSSMTA